MGILLNKEQSYSMATPSTIESNSLWWINLADEELIHVEEGHIHPGHRNTFAEIKLAAHRRVYQGKGTSKDNNNSNNLDKDDLVVHHASTS
jgi:hypothetical protein